MKKKIFLIVALIVALIPLNSFRAGELDSYIDWNLDRTIFAHQYRNDSDHITNLAMITANGKIAYCIEPGITASKGSYYSSTYDINDTKIAGSNIKKLSLIGYYGYGYGNHNAKEYYMAAQELIWREQGVQNVWWTDAKYGGNTINIDAYKNEILSLVNKYEVAPEFNFKKTYVIGDQVIIDDSNKILNEYEVANNQNVAKDGNKIKININSKNNVFTLKRNTNNKRTVFYYKEGFQTIGTFEYAYDYEKSYNVVGEYGRIELEKLDSETKNNNSISKYALLENAVYALYDSDNNIIEKKKTNKDGILEFTNLKKGTYKIKELVPSLGYKLNDEVIDVLIDSDDYNIKVKSYEEIIKNKITINKILDDNNICTKEANILFRLYDADNNLISENYTNSDGIINLELIYGKYTLKQITSPDNVDKVSDVIINVDENSDDRVITLVNHKIEKLPNTGKNILSNYVFAIPFLLYLFSYDKKKS